MPSHLSLYSYYPAFDLDNIQGDFTPLIEAAYWNPGKVIPVKGTKGALVMELFDCDLSRYIFRLYKTAADRYDYAKVGHRTSRFPA